MSRTWQEQMQRALRPRRGSEILEAALVFPLLLLLAFGTVEFGYWFYLEHNMQGAARDGVRAAIIGGTYSQQEREDMAQDAVDNFMTTLNIAADKYEVTFDYPEINGQEYMTVIVTANWAEIGVDTGLFMRFDQGGQTELVKSNAKIQGKATMRIES